MNEHCAQRKNHRSRFLLLGLVSLCALILPIQSIAMSEKKAAEIGLEMYQKITASTPIYLETRINKYVNDVGQKLVANSDDPEQNYKFTIIDSPDINAFATPGGYIYVHRGILTYMNSEAQLAAVLAHEIAHVTEDHASRQQRAQLGSNIVTGLATILTQSTEVGRASAMWGAATVTGYGRDMELEADRFGAKTMQKSGYNPQAMIEMIALLKDHERFSKKKARESGKKTQTYHGLFSSHPRNDQRLRQVIQSAGGKETEPGGIDNIAQFRIATNQLPWGINFNAQSTTLKRFRHPQYYYQVDFPKGWEFEAGKSQLSAKASTTDTAKGQAIITLERKARTTEPPAQFIDTRLGIPRLKKAEPLSQARLKGHTGIASANLTGGDEQRIAVIYYGRGAYVFTASSPGHSLTRWDKDFLAIIRSFRPYSVRRAQTTKTVHYVKAKPGATYGKLAHQLKLGDHGEEELRLINSAYPSGEPKTGQWIKIIR